MLSLNRNCTVFYVEVICVALIVVQSKQSTQMTIVIRKRKPI